MQFGLSWTCAAHPRDKMASHPSRSLSAIFCDEIRGELGNKKSLIGLYQGSSFLPEFPFVLPKCRAFITHVIPYSDGFKSLKIRLLRDEAMIMEYEVPSEALKQEPIVPLPNVVARPDNQVSVFNMPLVLTPF